MLLLEWRVLSEIVPKNFDLLQKASKERDYLLSAKSGRPSSEINHQRETETHETHKKAMTVAPGPTRESKVHNKVFKAVLQYEWPTVEELSPPCEWNYFCSFTGTAAFRSFTRLVQLQVSGWNTDKFRADYLRTRVCARVAECEAKDLQHVPIKHSEVRPTFTLCDLIVISSASAYNPPPLCGLLIF